MKAFISDTESVYGDCLNNRNDRRLRSCAGMARQSPPESRAIGHAALQPCTTECAGMWRALPQRQERWLAVGRCWSVATAVGGGQSPKEAARYGVLARRGGRDHACENVPPPTYVSVTIGQVLRFAVVVPRGVN